MKIALFIFVILSVQLIDAFSSHRYNYISNQLLTNITKGNDAQGGSIFGVALRENFGYVIIGDPNSSPGELTNTGLVSYYKRNSFGTLVPSQPNLFGSNSFNMISGTVLGVDAESSEWIFIPAFGTPLNTSDQTLKDDSGAVIVQKLQNGVFVTEQIIYNPDCPGADKSACAFAFFGYNIGFSGNILVISGAGVNAAYEYRLSPPHSPEPWSFHRKIVPFGMEPGISLSVLDVQKDGNKAKGVMLISQGLSTFNPPGPVVFVMFLINGEWVQTQNLTGNPSCNVSNFFGTTMSIDGDWAIITEPLDCTAGLYVGSANFYKIDWFHKQLIFRQKVVSSNPNFLFGFSCKIYADVAFIGDPGRIVDGILYRGALQALEINDNETWILTQLLTDIGGSQWDQFGAGGLDFNGKYLIASNDRDTSQNVNFLPSYYPPTGYPPPGQGRVRSWVQVRNY